MQSAFSDLFVLRVNSAAATAELRLGQTLSGAVSCTSTCSSSFPCPKTPPSQTGKHPIVYYSHSSTEPTLLFLTSYVIAQLHGGRRKYKSSI